MDKYSSTTRSSFSHTIKNKNNPINPFKLQSQLLKNFSNSRIINFFTTTTKDIFLNACLALKNWDGIHYSSTFNKGRVNSSISRSFLSLYKLNQVSPFAYFVKKPLIKVMILGPRIFHGESTSPIIFYYLQRLPRKNKILSPSPK